MKAESPFMGSETSKVFSGEAESLTTKEMYSETAGFFADQIKSHIPESTGQYVLADVGSFQGELLSNVVELLNEYKFETVAVDINEVALVGNKANKKIVSSGEQLPFDDNSIDVVIMRYVLQWNNAEKQKKILKEINRVTKTVALIEHVGSDTEDTENWRGKQDELVSGIKIPKLKRGEHFYSSRDEIETWMSEQGIKFFRLRDRKIAEASNAYIERFGLDENEADTAREILGNKDYFMQTDWAIFPKD